MSSNRTFFNQDVRERQRISNGEPAEPVKVDAAGYRTVKRHNCFGIFMIEKEWPEGANHIDIVMLERPNQHIADLITCFITLIGSACNSIPVGGGRARPNAAFLRKVSKDMI